MAKVTLVQPFSPTGLARVSNAANLNVAAKHLMHHRRRLLVRAKALPCTRRKGFVLLWVVRQNKQLR